MLARIEMSDVFTNCPLLPECLQRLNEAVTLEKSLAHLVKIRSSQLNGCAFCLDMHLKEARNSGEREQRLDTLAAWRDSHCFSHRERAALAYCENATALSTHRVDDDLYRELQVHFTEQEIIELAVTLVVINAWNRVVATFRFIPAD